MLNQGGVTKTTGATQKIILVSDVNVSLSCMVANTGLVADSDGKKIVLAGTPLAGSLIARGTAFTVAADTGEAGSEVSDATCVLLHDVDVTSGTKNAQCVIFGFIDKSKLESSVVSKYTTAALTALKNKITLVQ